MNFFSENNIASKAIVHLVLLSYGLICLIPIILMFLNSFKGQNYIFSEPLSFPNSTSFSLSGYISVLQKDNLFLYVLNSLIVTLTSIWIVIYVGVMAAWALTAYDAKWTIGLGLVFALGVMVPTELGTVSLLDIMSGLSLTNTLLSLILIYIAQSIPICIFILSNFIREVPFEICDAARCDGAREYQVLFYIVLPLIRPAILTVSIFVALPIWNDLWFPLIFAPGHSTQTLILWVQQFIGQYTTDWAAVLAALCIAMSPVLFGYGIIARYLSKGLF